MLNVAIIGASGFTGVELLRLLAHHKQVSVVAVTSRQYSSIPVGEVFPSLTSYSDLVFTEPNIPDLIADTDVFFTAVPHAAAMKIVPDLLKNGAKVIDLSADFRLDSAEVYESWYQKHVCPEYIDEAVYGLCELNHEDIKGARLVANPGCYPTSILLPLIPVLKNNLVEPDSIVIDSKSGVSGAGRKAMLATSFCEVDESFKAYKIGEHRHTPEIEQELSKAAGKELNVCFTPHLVPMIRGILTTTYTRLARTDISTADVLHVLSEVYADKQFVSILPEGHFPSINMIKGSNRCVIGAKVDRRTNRLVLVSVIDNLVKGASGQAIQNMNIMMGFDESLGLQVVPVYP